MPRFNNISVQNNFVKGLITEATGLTFPENGCTSVDNCEFNHFGIVSRRLGFDLEAGSENFAAEVDGKVIVSFLWNNVAGEGDRVYVVTQIGDNLHFYNVSSDTGLSAGKHTDTIDLTDFVPAGVTSVSNLECQFASGNGLLFVTNPRVNSFYVKYDPDADTFTGTQIDVKIRDFAGDKGDLLGVTERPTSDFAGLSSEHKYNLANQGWTDDNLNDWDTARTDMPSNADVSWYFKNADDAFDFSTVDDRSVGNSPAPNGHFIYSVYDIDRSSNVGGANDESIDLDRLSTCAFFAGRVFYSGLKAQDHSSRIYFSQIVEDSSQYGNCYQVNDPTSETLFDELPTDGGVIDILEAGTIFKMVPVLNALVVFAANGVWAITGSSGSGFAANDYAVHRISSVTNISHTSFVDVEGIPFWWNLEGIYTLRLDPQTNSLRTQCVTDGNIRSYYLDIAAESKQFVRGCYDPFSKKVQWIFKSKPSVNFSDKYVYDRMLTLNLLSQAFYPWSVDISTVKINSIVNVFGLSGVFENINVVDSGDQVIDGSDNIIEFVSTNPSTTSVIKYLVSYDDSGNQITFAENLSTTYQDWSSIDPVSYESQFITGYVIRGKAMTKFQQNYVNVWSEANSDTSFQIQGLWNYANAGDSGHWSVVQVISNFSDFKPKRIKIRGNGLACQLKFKNNGDNPFSFIGWSVAETGNQWI